MSGITSSIGNMAEGTQKFLANAARADKQKMYEEMFGVIKDEGRSLLNGCKVNKYTVPVAKLDGKLEFLMADAKDLFELQMKDPKGYEYITKNWGHNIQSFINDCGLENAKKYIGTISPQLKEFIGKCFKWTF